MARGMSCSLSVRHHPFEARRVGLARHGGAAKTSPALAVLGQFLVGRMGMAAFELAGGDPLEAFRRRFQRLDFRHDGLLVSIWA